MVIGFSSYFFCDGMMIPSLKLTAKAPEKGLKHAPREQAIVCLFRQFSGLMGMEDEISF